MRVLVDVMEIQGQDVVLAANVHAVMVFVHTQDPVVRRVEEVGEVMSRTGGSQLCLETQTYPLRTAAVHMHIFAHISMHAQLTHSSCIPVRRYLMVFHQHCCNLTLHIRDKCY